MAQPVRLDRRVHKDPLALTAKMEPKAPLDRLDRKVLLDQKGTSELKVRKA